jgi:hypothetical protein
MAVAKQLMDIWGIGTDETGEGEDVTELIITVFGLAQAESESEDNLCLRCQP